MDVNSIKKEIEKIRQEIKEREYALKTLENLMSEYGGINSIMNQSEFPKNARTEKQVMHLFESEIRKGIKMSDIQKIFKRYKDMSDVTIGNAVRLNVEEKNLILVKYNNSNTYSFYALPDWIDITTKDFKQEFKPTEDELPRVIKSVEI